MIERYRIIDRGAWLRRREQDLTASELGAAAGIDDYRTPVDVWAQKMRLIEPPPETSAMILGRWCEPAAICALGEVRPDLCIRYPLGLYLRDAELRLGGTPDAFAHPIGGTEDSLVVETKVVSRQSFERRLADGTPPLSWQLQTLTNAMLADCEAGLLVVLVLGFADAELVIFEVPRHPEAEARIRALAREFWAAFEAGHAPAPNYARDASVIRQLFPPDPNKPAPLDLSGDVELPGLLEQREELKTIIKDSEKLCSSIEAQLIHTLAGATSAVLPGWKVSYRLQHRDAYEVAAKDYPALRITRTKDGNG